MTRTFSGITPTGRLTLGNHLGALRRFPASQDGGLFGIMNLHAMTVEHDPGTLAERTTEAFGLLLAAGLDPDRAVVFVQGDVPAHAELAYLLECTATFGEMRRMIQFKEKASGRDSVRLSLLTYPALMAADILLYDADQVPVGADQAQHVELARDLAVRFNRRYGRTFTVPRLSTPDSAERVMDLADPTRKMSKTAVAEAGVIRLLDPPDVVRRKIGRAVTDAGGTVRYDPAARPGVANLLEILAALAGGRPGALAAAFGSYRDLKEAVADAVLAELAPLQGRYRELAADPAELARIRRHGAERARALAAPALARARAAIGLAVSGDARVLPAGSPDPGAGCRDGDRRRAATR
jgi:tryptophanyl-tRNA synthetase